jgi:hypothetical protein
MYGNLLIWHFVSLLFLLLLLFPVSLYYSHYSTTILSTAPLFSPLSLLYYSTLFSLPHLSSLHSLYYTTLLVLYYSPNTLLLLSYLLLLLVLLLLLLLVVVLLLLLLVLLVLLLLYCYYFFPYLSILLSLLYSLLSTAPLFSPLSLLYYSTSTLLLS